MGVTTPHHLHPANRHRHDDRSVGQRLADSVTAVFGSWRFIIIQTCIVAVWIAVNIIAVFYRWDPYPFILLNLLFSTQAAYAAPLILLSQNRLTTARPTPTGSRPNTTTGSTNSPCSTSSPGTATPTAKPASASSKPRRSSKACSPHSRKTCDAAVMWAANHRSEPPLPTRCPNHHPRKRYAMT